ncbi:hypothetical protein ONS95_000811 [Cadophora gregata]|uniref:uncharacterized protein n=1 Tax=Cadophora gregata TaxID=51156 RepID=UPI0026DC7DB4|nr:uncharacterized protein ONS95_000811 [Cadophora gregata]KAK0128863.1 hypothetical protein ONS95_000811 [Cadophora gregata]
MSSSSPSAAASSASSQYTCSICKTTFQNNTLQRTHAKSDWHIYNLKRHLTSLPPISYQIYNERIANVEETPPAEDASVDGFHQSCAICKKYFYKSKPYQNHLKSAVHAQAIAHLVESENDSEEDQVEILTLSDTEDLSSQDEGTGTNLCLFCLYPSPSLSSNLTHLHTAHNFSIPKQTSLIDLATFLVYLSTLITTFHECPFCGQIRDTAASIRQHILDKRHCRLPEDVIESEEFGEFWELDSEEDCEAQDSSGKEGMFDARFDSDTKQLHLPSGRILGHRSFTPSTRKPHHQPNTKPSSPQNTIENTTNQPSPSPSSESSLSATVQTHRAARRAAMALTRSENANKGLIGLSDGGRRAVRVMEKKMLKMEVRARNLYAARVERGANKQKFFKPDVPGPKNG